AVLPPHRGPAGADGPPAAPPARALRRPAAARRRRAGAGHQSRRDRRRRAHRQPRLRERRGGAGTAAGLGRRVRPDGRHGHPRPAGRGAGRPRAHARRRPSGRRAPVPHRRGRRRRPHADHRWVPAGIRRGARRRCTMIRIALSNLRRASGRLVAAGIAIAVSVAFMVAALLFAQGFGDTLGNQVRSSWAGADVAVMADEPDDTADAPDPSEVLSDDLLHDVTAVEGVESAHIEQSGFLMESAGTSSVSASVTGLPTDGADPLEGTLPDSPDELALTAPDAEALGVTVGDTVTLEAPAAAAGTDSTEVTVSGLLPGTSSVQLTLHLTEDGLEQAPAEVLPTAIRVSAAAGE